MARQLDVVTQVICKLSLLALCDLQQATATEADGFLDQLERYTRKYEDQVWSAKLLSAERATLHFDASEQGRL